MSKIRAILVDDEYESRQTLLHFLSRYCPDIEVSGEACSVDEAAGIITAIAPELVFLDINMPVENGFKLFEKLPDINFYSVFVTTYDEYAVQAFKHHAADYLLKPIVIHELVATVNRIAKLIEDKNKMHQLSFLLDGFRQPAEITKIALPTMEGLIYVYTMDIVRCEANDNYTHIYFKDGKKIIVSRTLAVYEEALKGKGFARVHNQHLINLQHVEKYIRGRGGIVIMSDEKAIQVSQRKKEEFLRLIGINI
ncbi:LytR/AlgR family response regulator transcription factor [Pedobacter panaciterrae]|uniref:LytR/AlgR family response regulator transcription factor n=1 Tax=Pedobacter panaciterrae TaxID=363849 RepID=UPI0025918B4F|nr:LytTR family DNA-binding domain-containing protein [uncultured Pedobacter sp.]